jgi:transposase
MYSVELYNRVRRACHVEGMSKSEAARMFGIDRKTVSKILKHSVPPGYRRSKPPPRPKLDPFIPVIDQILEDDKGQLKKQRHTAKRIHQRLRDEHGFTGGITIVTDYVREKKRRSREVFVPLSHPPGHAQVDFGEAVGVIGGVECKLHYFAMVDIGSAIGPSDNVDAAFGRTFHQDLPGRDDRGILRRAQCRFRILRRRAAVDPVRQHHDRGGEDLRRRQTGPGAET